MHELPVTQSILNISLEEAKKNNAKRINSINIKIGKLTGLVPESINYYFAIISKDTIANEANIVIEKLPLMIKCKDCLSEYEIDINNFLCKQCKSENIKIIGGKEFYVDSIEIDD